MESWGGKVWNQGSAAITLSGLTAETDCLIQFLYSASNNNSATSGMNVDIDGGAADGYVLEKVVDITRAPFSAVGDGTTDNLAALKSALTALDIGDTLFIPPGDYRMVITDGQIKVPAGVTLLGQNKKTKLSLLSSGGTDQYRCFLRLSSDVTLEGLTIERAADFPMVIFPLFGDISNIAFRNCVIDGNKTHFPKNYCHAIQVGVGKVKGCLLSGIEIRNCSYGLFQANNANAAEVAQWDAVTATVWIGK